VPGPSFFVWWRKRLVSGWRGQALVWWGIGGGQCPFKNSPFFLFQDKHRLVGATYTRCKSLVGCDFDNFV